MGPLHVGMSFGSVGNAPPLVAAALLRRRTDAAKRDTIVVLSIGSVCLQMALMEDGPDEAWTVGDHPRCGIRHQNILQGGGKELVIAYSDPRILDWSSPELQAQPLSSIVTDVNVRTTGGRITPIFRADA